MGYGQNGHLGISFQDSFGTSNVDSMDYFPMISETLTENIEDLMSESLSSRYEEPDSYPGMTEIAGDVVFEVHPHLIGKLCKAWAGQSSQDTFVESAYSHLFLPRNTDFTESVAALPPISVEVFRDTGSASLFWDVMVNQLSFEISQGAFYKVTASMIGARFSWINKSTPTYNQSSVYTWDTASISLAGSGIDDFSQLTINLNNNLATKAYIDGNRYPTRILRDGFRTVELSGTVILEGDTQERAYKNRTQQRLVMTFTDPATVMNANNQFTIDVPKMLYTAFPANISGPGLMEVGFSAKGKFDTTSEYAVQMTAVNTTPAY